MQEPTRSRTSSFLTFALFALTFTLFSGPLTQGRERDWQPHNTWVFIVGTLKWKHPEMFGPFPQKNRRDLQLAEFFNRQGVPADQLVYLQDERATTGRVRTAFADVLSRTREGDLLFVYFTGHGYKSDDERTTYFATYNASEEVPGWSTESIISDINRSFNGSKVLLTADCCFSGSLVKDARQLNKRISYACLTSSLSNQTSTENWTFTEALLAGLRGKAYADLNGDGEITISEIAEDAREDLAFAEDQQSSFATSGSFPPDTIIATALPRANTDIGRRVEVRSEGNWYKAQIVDAHAGRFHVHYYGYDDSDDEWVIARQIRRLRTADKLGSSSEENEWISSRSSDVDLIHHVEYGKDLNDWLADSHHRAGARSW